MLGVTTCLPAFIAFSIYSVAGSIPPMASTTISILSLVKTSSTFAVAISAGRPFDKAFSVFLAKTLATSISQPLRFEISSAFFFNISKVPPATVPRPKSPIFTFFIICLLNLLENIINENFRFVFD